MLQTVIAAVRAQWMGALALFLVMAGGTAYAANTVGSSDIIDESIQSVDLKNGQVRSSDIAANTVYPVDVRDDNLAGGGLGTVDIANESLKGTDIDESSFGAGVRTPGLIRSGSEDGSGMQPPGVNSGAYAGVVTRRTNSTSTDYESIARTDDMTLRRDGTNGGLVLSSFTTTHLRIIACQGVTAAGASVPFYANVPEAASNIQVYTNAQNVVRADCHFGDSYNKNHTTSVDLIRRAGDNFWIGFLTSTWNQ